MASHYPYFTLPYLFPIKNSLEKSYISASSYIENKISLISYSNPFISIRTYNNNLIYLCNSHSIETKTCDKKNFEELIKKLNDLKQKPNYLWSNIDIITNDGLPYIGRLRNNILISTGYNTWGLSTSFLGSEILKDIVLNKKNKYIKLFNPHRKTICDFKDNMKNIGKNIAGFIKGLVNINNVKNDNISKICPHLGCKLIYNEIEETWDCPCHGSRFSKEGNVISGPANKGIKKS
jgi:nitrite reductase/ring-hydroxylating ferredoxin subunit